MRNYAKYLSIVAWARNRYTIAGVLVIDTGGVPSAYSRIEDAAFKKYASIPRDDSGCLCLG